MKEIYKDIIGYEGLYQISNTGIVRLTNGKQCNIFLKPNKYGYIQRGLLKDGVNKKHYVHRLVAIAFIPNPLNKKEVNHINGIKHDNHVSNLEWVTPKENIRHAIDSGKFDEYWKNKSDNMKKMYKEKQTPQH